MTWEEPLRVLWSGIADFGRLLSLWFAFGLATNGLTLVIDAALVNEPFGWALWASSLVALGVAFVVYSWYPSLGSGTVWTFGAATYLTFVAVSALTNGLNVRTNGSFYYVLKTLLVWTGAVAIGYGIALTDDWRAVLRK